MDSFKATTIIGSKKDGKTAIAGDGQVTLGEQLKLMLEKYVRYIIIKFSRFGSVAMHLLYLKNLIECHHNLARSSRAC